MSTGRREPPSDADLIGRMRAGDDTAYEKLYRRHAGAVRRYALTCCRDTHTSDDLTAEVFARMLQAVRRGSGPEHAVRAYLLTTVRRVAAAWSRSARREHLVDDFAVFAAQAARCTEVSDENTLALGADVRAMQRAERSMAMRAFLSLPERWQAVLWHTEVEDEPPSQVAPLFGLDANGTRVLASRAREGLRQAYLQAHVSAALAANSAECARHADRLGAYARGGLRTRAERGLREHLAECATCRLAAGQIKEVAGGIPAVVPVAVIGWFGRTGYAKAAAFVPGDSGAGAADGSGGAPESEALGAPAKAGVVAGAAMVAAAALALLLVGDEGSGHRAAGPSAPRAGAVEAPPRVEEAPAPDPDVPPAGPTAPLTPAGRVTAAPAAPAKHAPIPIQISLPGSKPGPKPTPTPSASSPRTPPRVPVPALPAPPRVHAGIGPGHGVAADGTLVLTVVTGWPYLLPAPSALP